MDASSAPVGAGLVRASVVDAVKRDFAASAPDEIISYFLRVADHRGLDPWGNEIVLVPRRNPKENTTSWHYEVTIEGRRTIAHRTGRLEGIDGPYWCGPRTYDGDGHKLPLEWVDVWDDDETPPYAARCFVWPAGWKVPANGTVKWAEFAQWIKGDQPKLGPFWRKMPAHMLGKCAESLALRRAFREVEVAVADETKPLQTVEIPGSAQGTAARGAPLPPPAAAAPAGPGDKPPTELYDSLPEARGYA
jgi:phage recombination protein Bet